MKFNKKQFHKKFYPTQVSSIDEENFSVWARFSDDQEDREGDIMDQDSWDFDDWMKAPTVLWGHDDSKLPIGTGLEIKMVEENGVKAHDALIQLDVSEDYKETGKITASSTDEDRVWDKIKKGVLRTLSVGYVSEERDGNRLLGNKLLEVSFVSVPANIHALVRGLNDRSITDEDAKWLKKQAEDAVKSLTKHLQKSDNQISKDTKKEKSMSEEDLKKVVEEVSKAVSAGVAEAIKPLQSSVEAQGQVLEEISKGVKAEPTDPKDPKSGKPKTKPDTNQGGSGEEDITEEDAEIILAQVDAMLAGKGESDPENTGDEE